MKCKDCDYCKLGWFSSRPKEYVCIGVKEPFVVSNTDVECTEYPSMRNSVATTSKTEEKLAEPYVDNDGIYVRSDVDPRFHKLIISRELFVEAYNKWIKKPSDKYSNIFIGQDGADDWSE